MAGEVIICPRGDESRGPDLRIDLEPILRSEARLGEVAFVNPGTAPHLLTTYNAAWLRTAERVAGIEYEVVKCKESVAKRRAILLLDELPAFLEAHENVGNNAETRQAFLTRDVELARLQERVEQASAVLELLKIKAKAFENAFSAVKRIMQVNGAMGGAFRPAPGDGPAAGDELGFGLEEVPAGARCSVCDAPQYSTYSGITCKNGHGGAPTKEQR